jgi:hypothetical protein
MGRTELYRVRVLEEGAKQGYLDRDDPDVQKMSPAMDASTMPPTMKGLAFDGLFCSERASMISGIGELARGYIVASIIFGIRSACPSDRRWYWAASARPGLAAKGQKTFTTV